MGWDQFVQIGATILYWTLLWVLLSVPAALALLAVSRFFPGRVSEAVGQVLRFRPGANDAAARFKERREVARARLELGTVRVLLDRKHARLKRELGQIRSTLDRRLQRITLASRASGGASLIDLLAGFKADAAQALQFDDIDDNLPDRSSERSKAVFKAVALAFAALAITAVNFSLLYLYFDELFGGLTVPYLRIDLAIVVALLFPVMEMGGGLGSELAKEKSDSAGTKLVVYAVVILLAVALGSFEYVIFYQLMAGGFAGQQAFASDGLTHIMVALMGPALTAVEALFGFGIARNVLRLLDLGAIRTVKDHVAIAQRFVNGLETRYDRIEEAAARASQSIDELTAQVKGRGEAELPAVTLLAEERQKFVAAMDEVNPGKWQRDVAPAEGDVEAVAAYAAFLPLGVVLLAAVFALVFAPAIDQSGLFPARPGVSVLLAVATSMIALLSGQSLFDRATSAIEHDASWKDVLSPRDGAFKVASVIALALLATGIVWICFAAQGLIGLGAAAILLAMVAGLCWCSSYADLMLRGAAYLVTTAWHALVWALNALVRLIWSGLVTLAAGMIALLLFVLSIVAWPVTFLRSLLARERAPLRPAASLQ